MQHDSVYVLCVLYAVNFFFISFSYFYELMSSKLEFCMEYKFFGQLLEIVILFDELINSDPFLSRTHGINFLSVTYDLIVAFAER